MDEYNLTDKDSYKFWVDDVVRAADIDYLNHVNNVSTPVFCESGRVALWQLLSQKVQHDARYHFVLRAANFEYLKAAYYPDKIMIGTKILKIGNSSVTLGQGLFSKDGCFSSAIAISVWADVKAEKATPLTQEIKSFLQSYM